MLKKNISILILVFFQFALIAQKNAIRFDKLTIKDGLTQSSINKIVQDKKGFIWIATQDGLNRYDGYQFTTFYHSSEDSASLPNNYITDIVLDSIGNVWLATESGIAVFYPQDERFVSFSNEFNNPKSICAGRINKISFDKKGMLWGASASNGLFMLNPTTKEAKQFHKGVGKLIDEKLTTVFADNNNTIWIGYEGKGISIYKQEKKQFTYLPKIAKKGNFIKSIFQDNRNRIWLGSVEGLYYLDNLSEYKKANSYSKFKLSNGGKIQNIRSINQTNDGNIWIGTAGNGLFNIDVKDKNSPVKNYIKDPSYPASLNSNIIYSIEEDAAGLIWIGTNNGINKFDPKKQSFKHFRASKGNEFGLLDNTVWSIYDDLEHDFMLVGTREGLNFINQKTGKVTYYENISSSSIYQSNKSIFSITKNSKGAILIGTSDGIYQLKSNKIHSKILKFKQINYNNFYFKGDVENKIYTLLSDNNNQLWVGTKNGLAKLSSDYAKKVFLSNDENNQNNLPSNIIRSIIQTKDSSIYLGTEGGLCKIIDMQDSLSVEIIPYLKNEKQAKSAKIILSLYEDENEIIWIGTFGGGLIKYNPKTKESTIYTIKDGLSNNVVYGILGDDSNRLWLSTNKGISMFDTKSNVFMSYYEKDGLQSDEFNIGAFFKNGEGALYFGGINGFNKFHPNDVAKNKIPPQLVFTEFKINNKAIKTGKSTLLTRNLNYLDKLELSYKINNFTFEYAALHFSYSEKNQYAYKMVGFDEDWNYVGKQRYAHYTNLDAGEYIFIVKGSNSDGIWSDNVAKIKLIILPPFWKTWWFLSLTFLGIVGLAFLIVRFRIKIIKDQKIILEKLVDKRTAKVLEQKSQLLKQKEELEAEKEKSELLLLNILPEHTVVELKLQGKAKARNYRRATVMFTDFKGFTKFSESVKPSVLVEYLDSYFIKFDGIIEKYNIEKIKTIGDAYMCAGGLPIRNKSNPIEVVLAGLEIQRFVQDINEMRKAQGKQFWELRLGINTGEVIAGVIGVKRFAYDIWGDTVNVANRMEMSGEVGKVNISGKTYKHIKNYFDCTYRGMVLAKNKGEVQMYFVEGIKPELSVEGKGIRPNALFWDYVDLDLYSSINYRKAENFIVKMLEEKLAPNLYYHNINHMKDVCASVERIAKGEGIKNKELFLLKTAALYHDAGFIEQYPNNEHIGARMAREALPVFGYSEEEIALVEELILATEVPQKASTQLQQIICDADLDYLGRPDFYEISEGLQKEFIAYNIVKDSKAWDEIQIKFLSSHRYFTKTAKATRSSEKFKRLDEIKKRFAVNNY